MTELPKPTLVSSPPGDVEPSVTSAVFDGQWIDQRLSKELPSLRDRGEGQNLEFKSEFPPNAQGIGREIAAFATSGGGTILLGVNDTGELVGLPNLETADGRDALMKRIEGVCNGQVRPAVTPTLSFLAESDKIVVAITIPKGTQPVYYCHSTPYVRHLSSSRAAEPHEVIELVRNWMELHLGDVRDTTQTSEFFTSLAITLTDIVMLVPEINDRSLNPWLDTLRAQFRSAASTLRELAATDTAESLNFPHTLKELADACEAVAEFRLYLGQESYQGFLRTLQNAGDLASAFMSDEIESRGLLENSAQSASDALRVWIRRLDGLLSRLDAIVQQGNIDELQNEASRIGEEILRLTFMGLNHISTIDVDHLRNAARTLHLVETQRVYLDGGTSVLNIVSQIRAAASDIATALAATQP